MTIKLLEELETTSKRFSIAPNQAADLDSGRTAEEITITWQRTTGQAPAILVTAPAGPDGWATPIPHRPSWLMNLIVKEAPAWWLR
ncbi:hypothetical protein [Streptomyces sp. TE5632]